MRVSLIIIVLLAFVGSSLAQTVALPQSFTVDTTQGVVHVKGRSTAKIQYVVKSVVKIKWTVLDGYLVVSVPSEDATVLIYAVALDKDGKVTDVASTTMTVKRKMERAQPRASSPSPPLFFTVVMTVEQLEKSERASVVSAASDTIKKRGDSFRVMDENNDELDRLGLRPWIARAGALPVLIIQDKTGKVFYSRPLPKTVAEVVSLGKR